MQILKTIGSSGQISLGKEYAGRHVVIDQIQKGTWIIKTGHFIPDNETWLHEKKNKKELDAAIKWAEENPSCETDLMDLEKKIKNA